MNQLELSVKLKLAAEQFVKEATRASTEFKQAMSGIEQTAGKAGNGVESGFGKTRQGLVSISQQLQQTKNELIAFFSLRYGAELALSIIKTADAVAGLQSRLKLATTSAAEYATAQNQLFDISQRTATSMESSVVLYGRIAASMRDMGLAQTDTLAFTEAVAQTMRISGASAATAEAGITQLAQAMASGVLRGDEFNSVMENSPRLSQALADGLGEPIGALRAMAEAGELTAEKVTNALLSQKDVLASEYASMGLTVSAAMTQLSNAWQQYIGEADQAEGATKSLSAVISDIATNFNDYANTVITVGKDALVIWAGFAAIKLGAAAAEFFGLTAAARASAAAMAETALANTQAAAAAATLVEADRRAVASTTESAAAQKMAAASADERALSERNLAFAREAVAGADKLAAIAAAEAATAHKAASASAALAAMESANIQKAAALETAAAEKVATAAILETAKAHQATIASALAEQEATLAMAQSAAIYGNARAAAERNVAAARLEAKAATESVILAETSYAAAVEKTVLAETSYWAAVEKKILAETASTAALNKTTQAEITGVAATEKLTLSRYALGAATEKVVIAETAAAAATTRSALAANVAAPAVTRLAGASGLLNKALGPLLTAFIAFEVLKVAGEWLGEFVAKLVVGDQEVKKFSSGVKLGMEVSAAATRVARDEAAKLAAEIERTNQLTAFEHFGESAESARQKIEIAVAGMVAAFAQTYAKAQDVGKALDALFKDVNFSSPASLDAMTQALDKLSETAYATGEQIKEGIGRALDKLSTEDLRKFQIAAEAAFGGAEGSAEKLAAMLDASLGSAFRRLGGDLEKFRTGIDQITRDAIEAFSAVAENARASGAEIGEAFKLALKTADTRQEVDALGASLKNAAADGVIAGKALEDAQTRLAAKVRETAGEVEGALGDAFKRAGIKSRAELNAIAEQAKADFEAIKQSGQATEEGIGAAEKKYQDAEKAAKGVKEETKAIADEAGHAAGKTGEMADAATEVQASMNDAGSAAGSAVAFINDYMDGAKALYQQLGLTKQAIDDIFLRSIDRSMSWERAFKNAIEIYEQAVAAVERQKKSLSDAAAETQRLGAYADDVTRNFNATVQAANDLALGMDNAASAGASMQAGSTDPKINEALQQQWAAAEKLAQAYASIERSARSAAKSAEDAVRGFVSSSRSIHEELLTAQGKEDEAAASRFAARRADLEMSYKQLQVQIMIAEVQAKAAGIDTAELSQAKSDAAAAFNQAKNDLAQLEKIDAERRKKAKQDAANDARDAAAKAAAEKASADAAARQQMTNQAIPQTNNSAYGSAQAAASAAASSARSTGTASNTNNFYISGFTGSEDDVRRKIVPVLDKINYGSR